MSRHNNHAVEKRPHVLWTRDETACLATLIKKRTPIREIAEVLEKSEKAIRRKCEWLGVSSSTTYRPRPKPKKTKTQSKN